ncbi:MAG: hypothetical protein OJF49_002514 [Ktedonobacterales bacterium]|jgi:small-conductance mechanosensitive channel|nr:MAG: hypothetical protein OJF49_002514 [Ktedonobacterales bacterium]
MNPGLLATAVATSPDSISKALDTALSGIGSHPVQAGLTVVIVLVALVAGRWLSHLASRVPVSIEARRERNGKTHGKAGGKKMSRVLEVRPGMGRWLGRFTLICVWLAAAVAITLLWLSTVQATPEKDTTIQGLQSFAKNMGASLLVIAIALGLGRRLQSSVVASVGESSTKNLALLGGRLVYVSTLALGFVIILAIWGTGIVFPVALLGALTVALSVALQDVLKNLVAGIYLLIEHPFLIGDQIAIDKYSGQVEDIQIRYTALLTADGQRVLMPNSLLFTSPVVNMSAYDKRRVTLTVTIPDGDTASVERARAGILSALKSVHDMLPDPEPRVILNGASGGKVGFSAIFWLPTSEFAGAAGVLSTAMESIRAQVAEAEVSASESAAPPAK